MVTVQNPKRQRFATKKPAKPKRRKEWELQAAIIAKFHELESQGWPFTCAGDQNAARRGFKAAAIAKITGMTAGEPDIRVYLPGAKIGLIELKAEDGELSKAQEARHKRLNELGHYVFLLQADNDNDAVDGAVGILKGMLEK